MRIKFRETYTVHRWRVLIFVLLFSLLTQWTRWLPVYLSSVSIDECEDVCENVAFEPICIECVQDDYSLIGNETYTECNNCRICRIEYDSENYNLQDGVCMTTSQYGLITGLGFSLTFSSFGLLAGFLVDQTSERGSTILGCSALICGVVTLLSSFCVTFSETLVLRAILGAMQAFGAPASVHLITTYFRRPSERPFANASYTVGLYLGAGLSSLSTIFSKDYLGWRNIYISVGWFSIIISIFYELLVDLEIELVTNDTKTQKNNIDKEDNIIENITKEPTNERSPLIKSNQVSSNSPKSHFSKAPITPTSPFHPPPNDEIQETLNDTMDMDTDVFENEIAAISSPMREKEIIKSNVSTPINFTSARDDSFKFEREVSYTTLHEIVHHDDDEDAMSDINSVRPSAFARISADHSDTESNVSEYSNQHSMNRRSIFEKQQILIKDQDICLLFISVLRLLFFGGPIPYALPVLFCASCLRFIGSIATFVYIPLLINRRFPSEDKSFSIFNAIVVLSCGSISAFLGGKFGQIAFKKFGLSGLAKLVALSCLLSIAPFILAFTSEHFWISMTMLALGYLIGEAWMGASMALLQALSPKKGQGLAMSVYLFINWNAAAIMTDFFGLLDPGTENISNEMILGVSLPIFGSFLFFSLLDRIVVQAEITAMNHISRRNDI